MPETTTRQIRFRLDGDFITDHIQNLVEEGRYSLALKTAESCLMNDQITSYERLGLAFGVMAGNKIIQNGKDENTMQLVDTDKDVDVLKFIEHIIDAFTEKIEEQEDEINKLSNKLSVIYDSCLTSYPEALRHACIEWMTRGYPKRGMGWLFGDECSIPGEVIDEYNSRFGYLWNKSKTEDEDNANLEAQGYSAQSSISRVLGQNDPVAQWIEMQNAPEDKLSYGWLDPKGTFHEADWGQHESWAREYLEENAPDFTESDGFRIYECGDEMVRRGWVLLHSPSHGIAKATLNKNKKLTSAQKKFLFDYYTDWDRPTAADAAKHDYMEEVPEYFDIIDVENESRG